MSTPTNRTQPFLVSSRSFPSKDLTDLTNELDRMYIDIASKVNARSIGMFTTTEVNTGDNWVLSGRASQKSTFRKVIPITGAGNYAHNLTIDNIGEFVKIYGAFTDGSGNSYPLPYVDVTNVNNQVALSITSTNVVVTAGGGSPPTISSGKVVIEWLSV